MNTSVLKTWLFTALVVVTVLHVGYALNDYITSTTYVKYVDRLGETCGCDYMHSTQPSMSVCRDVEQLGLTRYTPVTVNTCSSLKKKGN